MRVQFENTLVQDSEWSDQNRSDSFLGSERCPSQWSAFSKRHGSKRAEAAAGLFLLSADLEMESASRQSEESAVTALVQNRTRFYDAEKRVGLRIERDSKNHC